MAGTEIESRPFLRFNFVSLKSFFSRLNRWLLEKNKDNEEDDSCGVSISFDSRRSDSGWSAGRGISEGTALDFDSWRHDLRVQP
jgi:hypothetical protein